MIKVQKTQVTVNLTISLQDFIDYLDKRGWLDMFAINIQRSQKTVDRNKLIESFSTMNPIEWVSCLFVWCSTEEGSVFWNDVRKDWIEYLRVKSFEKIDAVLFGYSVSLDWKGIDISDEAIARLIIPTNQSMMGKKYYVRDNSYNRQASLVWEQENWDEVDERDTWINIIDTYGSNTSFLILSETPETKYISLFGQYLPKLMIKIWLPKDQKVQWVLYKKNWVCEEE